MEEPLAMLKHHSRCGAVLYALVDGGPVDRNFAAVVLNAEEVAEGVHFGEEPGRGQKVKV